MLRPLLRVQDIMERYKVSSSTARRFMRQMRHTEKPLTVSEDSVRDWELSKTVPAENEIIIQRHIVPRRR